VDKANDIAVNMYKKFDFEILRENEHDYIMVLKRNREQHVDIENIKF